VGSLAWVTQRGTTRHCEQFGETLVITDKNIGRSKGYGFVTHDPEIARRASIDPTRHRWEKGQLQHSFAWPALALPSSRTAAPWEPLSWDFSTWTSLCWKPNSSHILSIDLSAGHCISSIRVYDLCARHCLPSEYIQSLSCTPISRYMVHLELLVLQYILTLIWARLCKPDLRFQPIKVLEFRDLI
jgi:hypothetical protein